MTAPICRVRKIMAPTTGAPQEHHAPDQRSTPSRGGENYGQLSEWLRNVLEHCDRATSTSLATMRALGKDSSKIRKAVER